MDFFNKESPTEYGKRMYQATYKKDSSDSDIISFNLARGGKLIDIAKNAYIFQKNDMAMLLAHGTKHGGIQFGSASLTPQAYVKLLEDRGVLNDVKKLYTIDCYGGKQESFISPKGIQVSSSHTAETKIRFSNVKNKHGDRQAFVLVDKSTGEFTKEFQKDLIANNLMSHHGTGAKVKALDTKASFFRDWQHINKLNGTIHERPKKLLPKMQKDVDTLANYLKDIGGTRNVAKTLESYDNNKIITNRIQYFKDAIDKKVELPKEIDDIVKKYRPLINSSRYSLSNPNFKGIDKAASDLFYGIEDSLNSELENLRQQKVKQQAPIVEPKPEKVEVVKATDVKPEKIEPVKPLEPAKPIHPKQPAANIQPKSKPNIIIQSEPRVIRPQNKPVTPKPTEHSIKRSNINDIKDLYKNHQFTFVQNQQQINVDKIVAEQLAIQRNKEILESAKQTKSNLEVKKVNGPTVQERINIGTYHPVGEKIDLRGHGGRASMDRVVYEYNKQLNRTKPPTNNVSSIKPKNNIKSSAVADSVTDATSELAKKLAADFSQYKYGKVLSKLF